MAMSRLRGARSVTSRSPIQISPSGHVLEAGDHPQQRRLAAAGRADEDEELAVGDLERDVVDGRHRAERLAHVVELDRRHRGDGIDQLARTQAHLRRNLATGIDQSGRTTSRLRCDEARCRSGARRRPARRRATSRSSTAGSPRSASARRNGRGIAVPGFVDLQVNGFGGVDFLDADADGYRRAGEALLETGVTAYLPTLITSPEEQILAAMREVPISDARPRILGMHLEGPFLSPNRLGTHEASSRRDPDLALLDRLLDGGPGAADDARARASRRDGADRPAARARRHRLARPHATRRPSRRTRRSTAARAASRTSSTRCGRSCTAIPGIVGAALARDDVVVWIIVDGIHLAPETVRVDVARRARSGSRS